MHKAYTIFYIVELSKSEVFPLLSLNLSTESYSIRFFFSYDICKIILELRVSQLFFFLFLLESSEVGTAGAMQVPVVGLQPLRSVEQPGPETMALGSGPWGWPLGVALEGGLAAPG